MWVLGGGLVGLLVSVVIVASDKLWFRGGAPLRTAGLAATLAILGALVGALIRRRRAE
jgi:hypothetical protein